VPGCMMTLGVGYPNRKVTPLHTATFELNEAGLLLGPKLLTRCLLHWSKKRETV